MGEQTINELAAENIELRSRLNSAMLVIRQLDEWCDPHTGRGAWQFDNILQAVKRIIEREKRCSH